MKFENTQQYTVQTSNEGSKFALFCLLGKLADWAIYSANVFSLFSPIDKSFRKCYIFYRSFFFIFLLFFQWSPPEPRWLRNQWSDLHQNFRIGRQLKGLDNTIELFLIFQGTLPWQPIKVEKSTFFPDQSTLSRCYSETDCNISIPISKCSPQ